jgi:glycosyltransferase involved in cell wall biosynthesis
VLESCSGHRFREAARRGQGNGLTPRTFHVLGSVKRRYQDPADTSPLNRIRVEVAVARAANRIVVTATKEIRELALLGVPSSKVSVVPCGVDLEHFTPSPKCFAIGTEAQLSLSATERWSAGAA